MLEAQYHSTLGWCVVVKGTPAHLGAVAEGLPSKNAAIIKAAEINGTCALCGTEMNVLTAHPYDDPPYDEPTIENVESAEFSGFCAFCAVTRRSEVLNLNDGYSATEATQIARIFSRGSK